MSIIQRPDCEGGDMDEGTAADAYAWLRDEEAETVETPTLSDAELLELPR